MPVNGNQDAANFNDDNISGAMWSSGQPALTRYIHVMPPNTWSCRSGLQIAHVANSRHPGGVNVTFCDGSVKFIKSTVNLMAWWALGSRRRRSDFVRSILRGSGDAITVQRIPASRERDVLPCPFPGRWHL